MNSKAELDGYFELMKTRPEAFTPLDGINIETDRETLEKYIRTTGVALGLLYESTYSMLLVDLIRNADESYYIYERILPSAIGEPVVCVVQYRKQFVLLRQRRHALRDFAYAFPRGYGENGLSVEQNAAKEIQEELGAEIHSLSRLGRVVPDSGLTSCKAHVVFCEADNIVIKKGYEGIDSISLLSEKELERWIGEGRIEDGFTLAAFALYRCQKQYNLD